MSRSDHSSDQGRNLCTKALFGLPETLLLLTRLLHSGPALLIVIVVTGCKEQIDVPDHSGWCVDDARFVYLRGLCRYVSFLSFSPTARRVFRSCQIGSSSGGIPQQTEDECELVARRAPRDLVLVLLF